MNDGLCRLAYDQPTYRLSRASGCVPSEAEFGSWATYDDRIRFAMAYLASECLARMNLFQLGILPGFPLRCFSVFALNGSVAFGQLKQTECSVPVDARETDEEKFLMNSPVSSDNAFWR